MVSQRRWVSERVKGSVRRRERCQFGARESSLCGCTTIIVGVLRGYTQSRGREASRREESRGNRVESQAVRWWRTDREAGMDPEAAAVLLPVLCLHAPLPLHIVHWLA